MLEVGGGQRKCMVPRKLPKMQMELQKKCNESVRMRKKLEREGEVILLEVGGGQRTCLMERTLRALRLRCRRKFGDISCFLLFIHHLWKLCASLNRNYWYFSVN